MKEPEDPEEERAEPKEESRGPAGALLDVYESLDSQSPKGGAMPPDNELKDPPAVQGHDQEDGGQNPLDDPPDPPDPPGPWSKRF